MFNAPSLVRKFDFVEVELDFSNFCGHFTVLEPLPS